MTRALSSGWHNPAVSNSDNILPITALYIQLPPLHSFNTTELYEYLRASCLYIRNLEANLHAADQEALNLRTINAEFHRQLTELRQDLDLEKWKARWKGQNKKIREKKWEIRNLQAQIAGMKTQRVVDLEERVEELGSINFRLRERMLQMSMKGRRDNVLEVEVQQIMEALSEGIERMDWGGVGCGDLLGIGVLWEPEEDEFDNLKEQWDQLMKELDS